MELTEVVLLGRVGEERSSDTIATGECRIANKLLGAYVAELANMERALSSFVRAARQGSTANREAELEKSERLIAQVGRKHSAYEKHVEEHGCMQQLTEH